MDTSTALAIASAALLGAGVVLANIGLRYLDSARGALVSIPSTMALYWVLAVFMLRLDGWNALAFGIFVAVGFIFPAFVTLLGFESNRRAGATLSGTISATTPLFATLGAVIVLGEALTPRAAAGTCAIVLGVVALTWRGSASVRNWAAWVILLPLAGAAIRGGALAVVKGGLALWPDPFIAGLVGYTISTLTIVAANRALGPRRASANPRGVPWFMGVGLCNGSALLAMYGALNSGQVSVVSPLVGTYPVFTLVLSALFLREDIFRLRVLAGVGLTVLGVAILTGA